MENNVDNSPFADRIKTFNIGWYMGDYKNEATEENKIICEKYWLGNNVKTAHVI